MPWTFADHESVATGGLGPVDVSRAVTGAIVAGSKNVATSSKNAFARFSAVSTGNDKGGGKADRGCWRADDDRAREWNLAAGCDETKRSVGGHLRRATRETPSFFWYECQQRAACLSTTGGQLCGGPVERCCINPAGRMAHQADFCLHRFAELASRLSKSHVTADARDCQPRRDGPDSNGGCKPSQHREGPRCGEGRNDDSACSRDPEHDQRFPRPFIGNSEPVKLARERSLPQLWDRRRAHATHTKTQGNGTVPIPVPRQRTLCNRYACAVLLRFGAGRQRG